MSLNHTEPTIRNHKDTGALSEQSSHTSVMRFIRKLAFFLLVFYSISAAIYFFSDENRLTDRNAKIFVNDLQKGDLVIHQPVCEDRREVFQRILQNQNKHFTYLFIGSSRILPFGRETGFQNGLNLGVSGAVLEDVFIVDSLCKHYKITCDTLFVDFNPWYAQRRTDQRHLHFNRKLNLKDAALKVFQFNHSINNLNTINTRSKANYEFAREVKNAKAFHTKIVDGSSIHKPLTTQKRQMEIDHFVTGMYQMKYFKKINRKRLLDFQNWLHNKNQPVKVILSPFHPKLFELKGKDPRVQNILKLEREMKNLKISNVRVLGGFEPQNAGFLESDFYDGFHITDEAVIKKFRNP